MLLSDNNGIIYDISTTYDNAILINVYISSGKFCKCLLSEIPNYVSITLSEI